MRDTFERFLKQFGIKYDIERNGEIIDSIDGLRNTEKSTNKKYVGFRPGTDILPDDVLINEAGEKIYVSDIETSYGHNREAIELKAYFMSETEKNSVKHHASVFNIQNAYNSIIGNQTVASINYFETINEMRKKALDEQEDKEQIEAIINLLEMIVNNQVSPSKGLFSKFSNLMEKHSWITGSIASVLVSWLFSGSVH